MAQFDVHKNQSKTTKKHFPYIVDVQSPYISELGTRIVVPLGKLNYFKNEKMSKLTPIIEIDEEEFLFLTPQISSMPTANLSTPIGSLNHLRLELIDAIDFAISGF